MANDVTRGLLGGALRLLAVGGARQARVDISTTASNVSVQRHRKGRLSVFSLNTNVRKTAVNVPNNLPLPSTQLYNVKNRTRLIGRLVRITIRVH